MWIRWSKVRKTSLVIAIAGACVVVSVFEMTGNDVAAEPPPGALIEDPQMLLKRRFLIPPIPRLSSLPWDKAEDKAFECIEAFRSFTAGRVQRELRREGQIDLITAHKQGSAGLLRGLVCRVE